MKLHEALDILNEATLAGITQTMNNLITRIRSAKDPTQETDPIKQLARIAPNPKEPLKIKDKYGTGETAGLKEAYKKANQFFTQNAEKLKGIKMDVEGAPNAYDALKNTLTAIYNIISAGAESEVDAEQKRLTDKPLGGKPLSNQNQPAIPRAPTR